MLVKYDRDAKAKAMRLVREHAGDYASVAEVAKRLGMTPETLNGRLRSMRAGRLGCQLRVRGDLRAAEEEPGVEQTIEVPRAAASFFVREHDPLRR